MAHAVFISYADNDKDRKIALAVCSTLESRGIHCWMAPRDILPGKHYAEAIVEAINAAQAMVLILSSNSNSSPQVLREVERAASKDIPIVTFRTEDVALKKALEYFLSSYHWLEATKHPFSDKVKELADTIERLLLPPEEQLSEEKKREAGKPVAAEKKANPVWFWLGLLFFVFGLGGMLSLFLIQVASEGKANISPGVIVAWNLPIVLIGVILVCLSRRKINHRWFWPGAVSFTYGLVSAPSWLAIWHQYSTGVGLGSPLDLVAGILVGAIGAFCLWRGWPRTWIKHPRWEASAFIVSMCLICLAFSLLVASTQSVATRDILSFSDNFQDGKADGWNLDPGWQVVNENGNYVLSCQSKDGQRALPPVTSASDYALSADFKLLKNLFEFHVRQSGTGSYNVWIWENRVSLGKETSSIVNLGNADMDIGTTQWHKVEISLNGGNIKIYIDNSLKIDYQDENPLPSGSFLIQNHPDSGVELDNIVVKPSPMPTPTPIPTPTPTITPVSKIDILSFSDDFQSGNAKGWDLAPGWQVASEQGNYFLSCQGKDFAFATPRVTSASDYVLQADFMVISGNVNFAIRMNYDAFYSVGIGDNVVFLGKNKTVHDRVADAAINIADNQWHTVKIAVKGSNILVAIDGENRIDYWDSDPLPAGWFGMQNSENSSVRVDNIVVGPAAASSPTPTPQSAGTVIFSDDFQDGTADDWNFDPGWQMVREGSNYMLSCQSQGFSHATPPVPSLSTLSDYGVQMDFLLVSGVFDVHVRQSALGDYPVWPISNRVQLDKSTNSGGYVNLINANLDIGFNSWHTVKIALKGGNIKIYVDGTMVIDYLDAAYLPSGGFFIDCLSGSEIRVDNIVVTEI